MKPYQLIFILILLVAMQSCYVAKDYRRPEVVNELRFRTDQLSPDSISIAELSWKEMFTDPVLIGHIEKALENNMDIRIALQQIIAAEAYYKQGKAEMLPTISASGQVAHQNMSKNGGMGNLYNGGITQFELSANASWEADVWGKLRSNQRAFQASYLQTVAAHKAVKTSLIASIASVYYQLLAFDEQLRITELTVNNRKSSLETTKALKEAGYVSEVGVKQTEAQLLNTMALRVDIKTNIKLLENTFSVLLGEAPQSIQRNSMNEQLMLPEIKTGFPIQLLRNRPDVMAAEFNLIQAFELSNVAKSNFYPSLRISANGGLQSLELDKLLNVNSLFASAIGSLARPIVDGRRIRTQYEVALARQEQALLSFRLKILNAGKEVSDALYTYTAAEERIKIKTLEFEAYDLATGYSEELLNNGMINYLEVITARQNALFTQLELINARFTQLNATIEVYRALGGGWQ